MITPYRNPELNSPESAFNEIHSSARSLVERAIGVFKGRWRILLNERKSRYTPIKVGKISNVCAALHNICIANRLEVHFDIPPPDDPNLSIFTNLEGESGISTNTNSTQTYKNVGIKNRNSIKELF